MVESRHSLSKVVRNSKMAPLITYQQSGLRNNCYGRTSIRISEERVKTAVKWRNIIPNVVPDVHCDKPVGATVFHDWPRCLHVQGQNPPFHRDTLNSQVRGGGNHHGAIETIETESLANFSRYERGIREEYSVITISTVVRISFCRPPTY